MGDKQRGVMRRVKTNRKYEATTLATSQETSTGAISEAKAILIVNDDLADEISPQEFFNGELFGDIPGAVTKIVMQSQERGSCGCAIFLPMSSLVTNIFVVHHGAEPRQIH